MTSDDECDGPAGLRRALSVAAGSPPGTVDPVAARRAGDARARTKTAITTSLAFSLVIFAGLGSIYFAAHRSRPSSLGSDQTISTPFLLPSASTMLADRIYAGFATLPVTAGIPDTLHITGSVHGLTSNYVIHWGDGDITSNGNLRGCEGLGVQTSVSRYRDHAYSAAGTYTVIVTLSPGCAPDQTASFSLPVGAGTQPTLALPPVVPMHPTTSPTASISASPSPKPTPRASGSVKPGLTVSASPTVSGSASASPSPYSSASP